MYVLNKKTIRNCVIAETIYIIYRMCLYFFPEIFVKLIGIDKVEIFMNTFPDIFFFLLFIFLFRKVIAANVIEIKDKPKKYLENIVICIIITDVLTFAYKYMISEAGIEKSKNQEYLETLFDMNFLLLTFVCCIFGPFIEEILYRGILQGILIGKFKNRVYLMLTAVIGGIIFGMAHCNFRFDEILTIMPNIIFGIITGILYVNTKNIVCTTLVHMFVNSRATLFLLMMN